MPDFRVAGRLDCKPPHWVKGVRLEGFRVIGDAVDAVKRYTDTGCSEIVYVDVVASLYDREPSWATIERVAAASRIPITVAGGLESVEDAVRAVECGADRIAINTAAHAIGGLHPSGPSLLARCCERLGKQAVVLSVEARQIAGGAHECMINAGRDHTGREVGAHIAACAPWVSEALITSVDRDGTLSGPDDALLDKRAVPVMYSGGLRAEQIAALREKDPPWLVGVAAGRALQ